MWGNGLWPELPCGSCVSISIFEYAEGSGSRDPVAYRTAGRDDLARI